MINSLNSPGLWPQACQILDTFLFPLVLFPSSSLLPFFLSSFFPLLSSLFVLTRLFWEESARIWGAARGGWRGKLLGPAVVIISASFFLKSLCFSIPFFFDFGTIFDPKLAPKSSEILKNGFKIALDF